MIYDKMMETNYDLIIQKHSRYIDNPYYKYVVEIAEYMKTKKLKV